ncbi:MAG: hypothetical protein ACT4PV_13810 [Planctomycetaceae bacterium]
MRPLPPSMGVTMRRFLAWVVLLLAIAFVVHSVREASLASPPTADEAWTAFEEQGPDLPDADGFAVTEKKMLRGWTIWVGNYPKHNRGNEALFAERQDTSRAFREVRFFREPISYGAKLRSVWLTLTGNKP